MEMEGRVTDNATSVKEVLRKVYDLEETITDLQNQLLEVQSLVHTLARNDSKPMSDSHMIGLPKKATKKRKSSDDSTSNEGDIKHKSSDDRTSNEGDKKRKGSDHDSMSHNEEQHFILNSYIDKLGNTSLYKFGDIRSHETWAQAMIPQPVAAVIVLYPLSDYQLE
jgi:hypothetical protein